MMGVHCPWVIYLTLLFAAGCGMEGLVPNESKPAPVSKPRAVPTTGGQKSPVPDTLTPVPGALHEVGGAFSYDPPPGWKIGAFPGLKYRYAAGAPRNGFAANINVVDEQTNVPLEAYVNGSLAGAERSVPQFKLLDRGSVDTSFGLKGKWFAATVVQNGRALAQTYYHFERGDRKFVITCSCLLEDRDKLDPTFGKAVKSFRFD